jgi:hypothetical protein
VVEQHAVPCPPGTRRIWKCHSPPRWGCWTGNRRGTPPGPAGRASRTARAGNPPALGAEAELAQVVGDVGAAGEHRPAPPGRERHVFGAARRLDGDIAQRAALAGQVAAAAAVALAEARRVGPQGLDLAASSSNLQPPQPPSCTRRTGRRRPAGPPAAGCRRGPARSGCRPARCG